VIILVGFHIARLVVDYHISTFILVERIVEVLLISTLALLSWRWLRVKSTNANLRGNVPAAT
jgi:high-affinity Fe2+/Pb2+ permease